MNKSYTFDEFRNALQQYLHPLISNLEGGGTVEHRLKDINQEYFHCGIIALDNNAYAGHCVVYNNPHITWQNEKSILIGNIEFDSEEASKGLFECAAQVGDSLQAKHLIGPINGSTWNNYRFMTECKRSFFGNHAQENDKIKAFHDFGFAPIANYYSSIDDVLESDNTQVNQRAVELQEQGMTLRSIRLSEYENELRKLYDFNLLAFQRNAFYSPITWEEFRNKYIEVKQLINEDFVLIAEDVLENIIGFVFCYDNFHSKEKELIVKTIARHPDAKWRGMGQVLAQKIVSKAKQDGYKAIIHAFLIDEGTSTALSQSYHGEVISRYSLYAYPLK